MNIERARKLAGELPLEMNKRRRRLARVNRMIRRLSHHHQRGRLKLSQPVRDLKDEFGKPLFATDKRREEAVQRRTYKSSWTWRRVLRLEDLQVERDRLEAELDELGCRFHAAIRTIKRHSGQTLAGQSKPEVKHE